jgi:uroporphyrinogen-III synthase
MHVVVTRELGSNDSLLGWLPDDVTTSEVPLTTTRYFDTEEVLLELNASERFGSYRALVVTSARSALYVALARSALGEGGRVLSVGSATAKALENDDVESDVVGDGGAIDLVGDVDEGPVLILGAANMRPELATALEARGIAVSKLTCYETLPAVLSHDDEAEIRRADVLFIGAPSAWLVAKSFVGETTWVVVPGLTTAQSVRREHTRVIEGWGPELRQHLRAL